MSRIVQFNQGLKSNYDLIPVKDPDELYFCTDTLQIFLGSQDYTANVRQLASFANTDAYAVGTIAQYVGTTTSDFIKGHFYQKGASGWASIGVQSAADVLFDNTTSGLSSTNVQDAIDATVDKFNPIPITKAEYDALPESDKLAHRYLITDYPGATTSATDVSYSNTASGLSSDTVQDAIDELAADKVDKVTGKGLSTNDYTTADKNKLSGIATGATKTESSTTNGNIKINGTQTKVYDEAAGNLSSIKVGVCDTAANVKDKVVTIGNGTSWTPKVGDMVGVKYTYTNSYSSSASNPITLSVNGVKANIWYDTADSTANTGTNQNLYGRANTYIYYVYDGTNWAWVNVARQDGNNYPSVAVYTNADQQAKLGTCNYYVLTPNSYLHVIFRYANTYNGALTLNINNTGAKPIYINGSASSSTNKTLPAGTYIAFYDGTKFDFRTDGLLPATTTADKEIQDKIDVLSTSVSGNPLSFTTKSAQLANNAEIVLEPIQAGSGDPSPSNVRAISGYNEIDVVSCGKNLINYFEPGGIDSTTGLDADNPNLKRSGFILIKSNTTYILSGIHNTFRLFYYNKNREFVNSEVKENQIINVDNPNIFYIRFHANISTIVSAPQLELGSTATEYEPYNPATDITLKLNETVYGGKLDVRTGELVVDRKYYNAISAEFKSSSTINKGYKLTGLSDIKHISGYETAKITSNMFVGISGNAGYNTDTIGISTINQEVYAWFGASSELDTLEKANTWLANNPVQFVYELATPYTIQLTPHQVKLLQGDNVVTTNGTTINLDYNANGEIASLSDLSGIGESVNVLSDIVADNIEALQFATNNARNNITSRLSNLPTAIAEQNLEKYGYKIGDYFIGASGYYYHLADLDPFFGGYNSYAVITSHHVGIVVDTKATSAWNETADISSVNYKDSTLHTFLSTTALNIIKSDLTALFGSWENHLIKHDKLYAKLGGWAWSSSGTQSEYISALTECQVYGCPIWSADNYQQGEGARQLELFRRHAWMRVFGNASIWLRSISTASYACYASNYGCADNSTVTTSRRAAGLILFK